MNSSEQDDERQLAAPLLSDSLEKTMSLKQAALLREYRKHKVTDNEHGPEETKFESLHRENKQPTPKRKSPSATSSLEEHKIIRESATTEYYDPHRDSFDRNHPAKKHYIKREAFTEDSDMPVIVVPRARPVELTPVREVENSPVAVEVTGMLNHRGRAYTNPWHQEEEIMTDRQTVIYIMMNFGLAFILVTAVDGDTSTAPCAYILKQWLIILSLILASNSLLTIYGIDVQRKPVCQRKTHQVLKVAIYMATVGWLFRGIHLYFGDGITCKKEAPLLCFTMFVSLLLGGI
jgi:hypothetical protein